MSNVLNEINNEQVIMELVIQNEDPYTIVESVTKNLVAYSDIGYVMFHPHLSKSDKEDFIIYCARIIHCKTIKDILEFSFFSQKDKTGVLKVFKNITKLARKECACLLLFNGIHYAYEIRYDKTVRFIGRMIWTGYEFIPYVHAVKE